MTYEREPEPETADTPNGGNTVEWATPDTRWFTTGTRPAALCRACGAVIVTTPLNADSFWQPDPPLPRDPCPHCTATSWRPCIVHRVRVEIPGDGA